MRENLTVAMHANNKGVDQPAHPCSLISIFVIRYLESATVKLAPCKISIFLLVSVARQAVVRNLDDRFYRSVAHMISCTMIAIYLICSY